MLRLRDPRTAPQRRSACLQLEILENREVPSAGLIVEPEATSVQPAIQSVQSPSISQTLQQTLQSVNNPFPSLNLSQAFQQILQAANMAVAGEALSLEQLLTSVVESLPYLRSGLNVVSADLVQLVGPQAAQQDTQALVLGLDWLFVKLEVATQVALQDAGMFPNPTYNMDVAVLNAFMANPLSETPAV